MSLLGDIAPQTLDYVGKLTFWLASIPIVIIAAHIVSYLLDPLGLRAFPGPIFARFTSGWLPWIISQNRWSVTVDRLHQKYGTFVRLSPNHVSIAHPAALPAVYGHGSGAPKAPYYDGFVNFKSRNMFNTLSRSEHARKRRIESHMFSPQSVRALEGTASVHHGNLVSQWDKLYSYVKQAEGGGAKEGQLGASVWKVEGGRVWFDCMPCDLAFGAPFGMILAAKDTARFAKSVMAGMAAFGTSSKTSEYAFETDETPVTKLMAERADLVATIGWLPEYWQPIVRMLPAFRGGRKSTPQLAGLAVAAVAKRLSKPDAREDMLNRLLNARDEDDEPLSREELSAEAAMLIAAGADTVANTSCATTYYLARDQRVQAKLQAELDEALKSVDSVAAPYDAIKHLPYLDAVVNEGLRLHATIGAGLPRVVPEGGLTMLGHTFKEGTWVSVPVYHLHRDESIWGENASEFYPERWIEASGERKKAMLDAFAPFSVGPRACIGRNLALMQLHKTLATLFYRFSFVLESSDPVRLRSCIRFCSTADSVRNQLPVQDGFARKPRRCMIGIRSRKL
ncbi:cytochrome P450 monooxygenase pc-bph [Wolfiporia cocos MD-104 SS10]|uniref:Cytochrome P450 monooxygenase pc-bph n=1 Tax=Wolfiporia cocos (strain MD-104) TaxID=742152 RepID=A0A2H3K2B9_WOLCO|nr:cytochrome P450 monooxygenase pc-bph [Wolfiporia cocos MD-104 SS10]